MNSFIDFENHFFSIKGIIQAITETSEKLEIDTKFLDIDGYDSLAHIRIIMRIEEKFHVSFNADEIGRLTSINELITLLNKYRDQ